MTITHTDQPVHVTTGNGRVDAVDAVDAVAAVTAATSLLSALGLNGRSEHTHRTAERMVASYRDLLTPRPFDATTFANNEGHHDLVISRSVPFASLCAHHVLPFVGTATLGYRPGRGATCPAHAATPPTPGIARGSTCGHTPNASR